MTHPLLLRSSRCPRLECLWVLFSSSCGPGSQGVACRWAAMGLGRDLLPPSSPRLGLRFRSSAPFSNTHSSIHRRTQSQPSPPVTQRSDLARGSFLFLNQEEEELMGKNRNKKPYSGKPLETRKGSNGCPGLAERGRWLAEAQRILRTGKLLCMIPKL